MFPFVHSVEAAVVQYQRLLAGEIPGIYRFRINDGAVLGLADSADIGMRGIVRFFG